MRVSLEKTLFIHIQILLSTLGIIGAFLLKNYPNEWKEKLKGLRVKLDGQEMTRCGRDDSLLDGKMLKTNIGMELAANAILNSLEIPLDEERKKFEKNG